MIATDRAKVIFIVVVLMLQAGCGKPFNVKPRPDVTSTPPALSGEASGLEVAAEAVTDEDRLYDTFEANLIMAGVLPVRVRAANKGSEAVSLKKIRFELRTPEPRKYRAISAREAFNQVFSYYGVSIYSKRGYSEAKNDFASHGIDMDSPLAAGERREGLVFFHVPEQAARASGLVLAARNLNGKDSAVIELKLN